MIDEMIPANENIAVPPYKINWLECALVVGSGTIVMITATQGILSLLFIIFGG